MTTGMIQMGFKRTKRSSLSSAQVKSVLTPTPIGEIDYRLEFEIKALPKILSNGSHSHWRVVHSIKRQWKNLVALAVGYKKPAQPLAKARLTLIRHSSKEPDFDNLAISFKPIIDGLKECGVIADDKTSNIGQANYQWKKAKMKEGRITVIVESVN
jgi:Holliday junction resolvase RusA-like endonuclease